MSTPKLQTHTKSRMNESIVAQILHWGVLVLQNFGSIRAKLLKNCENEPKRAKQCMYISHGCNVFVQLNV